MADFFSRIFAIPSDVSSTYSHDEPRPLGGDINGSANPTGGRRKKKGHSRTLTPLSLTDGLSNTLTSSYVGTLSHDEIELSLDDRGSTQQSTTSNSSETVEEHPHHDDRFDEGYKSSNGRDALSPTATTTTATATTATGSPRGRQRRNDNSVNRSASEPRHSPTKAHRSSSMASSSHTRRINTSGNSGSGTNSRNMQLQLNSPTKKQSSRRHRTLSKMGSRGTAAATSLSSNKDPTMLTRVNSWSSGEERDGRKNGHHNEGRRSRSSSTRPASASTAAHASKKSARSKSSQPGKKLDTKEKQQAGRRMDSNTTEKTNNSSSTTTTTTKKSKNWRSKLTGGMKKLSPGGPGGGTPPLQKHKKASGSKKKKEFTNGATMVNMPKKPLGKEADYAAARKKLHLPPGQNQPIDIGDSIVISQQFLEDSMDMSVLTMPRELTMNEKESGGGGAVERFDKEIQEVGHGRVLEKDTVQAFLDRRTRRGSDQVEDIPSSSTGVSALYEKIGAYASRILDEGGIYQSYSQDQLMDDHDGHGELDGIEVRPAQRLGVTHGHDGKPLAHAVAGTAGGKHYWPCDPSAEGYSPKNGVVPPPPPPPALPRHGKLPSNTALVQPSSQPNNSAAVAAVPHLNTPASSSSNYLSIATSYEDPPGTLGTSPTLQIQPSSSGTMDTISRLRNDNHDGQQQQQRSKSDPPGDDPYTRPFDEPFSGLGNRGHATTTGINDGQNKLKSSGGKAVTFSLPPPQSASQQQSPPAPPFMGPPLDYYYSMERNPNNLKDQQQPMFSSPLLLPPIIELWSSVEGSDNVVTQGDNVNVIGSALKWDTRREAELVGEDLPLCVSEGWIDVRRYEEKNEEENEGEKQVETTNDNDSVHHQKGDMVAEKLNTSTTAADDAVASNWEGTSSSSRHVAPMDEDTPHDEYFDEHKPDDEYFDDILNCGDFNDHYDDGPLRQNSQDVTANHTVDNVDEGANFRHRSTWNTSYKPPKLSLLEEDSILQDRSRHNDNWHRLLRHRANATISIQKAVRGLLERQRLRLLLDAVLIIQPCIRRYLERKRYLEYIKLKRSYFPGRWKRSNMAVDV
eukprot:CAMPEP_0172317106 /NCGR_PEP_ID=MMETSP1058-20130122/30562_1 /TAXON_ID=83371 /ORGANISM="Detonula confervacea, Strain CCMP 353" /LENGTH=1075 /DNA_ID=CAMNT_0013031577 /DNA_START=53 /DNA_END=3280 /DNA_ORIENTATION=+